MTAGLGELPVADVRRLAERLDLRIRDGEVDDIRETVAALLEGATDTHGLPVRTGANATDRSDWWRPEEALMIPVDIFKCARWTGNTPILLPVVPVGR